MQLTKYRPLLTIAAAAALLFSFAGPATAAGNGGSTGAVGMKAKIINGEVYVKAGSMVDALGGSGQYDAKSGTFVYKPAMTIADVVAKVSPSVVGIIGKPDDFADNPQINDRYALAHGTGIIITSDGDIVTNAHVVKGMKSLTVVTSDAKAYAAKVVDIDEDSDIALIHIQASHLKPAAFGSSSDAQVGERVVAIGTPASFSLRNSATSGIISGLNRSIASPYRLLQTDAAINPGNSGGPLVDMDGKVIGINSMKFVDVSLDNMGFAIPSDTVQYVIHQFRKYGKVRRPYLGFDLQESWEAIVGLPSSNGLTVSLVASGSPAEKAGVKAGDILYSINGQSVSTTTDVNELLKSFLPGDEVELMFQSDGDLVKRKVALQEAASGKSY